MESNHPTHGLHTPAGFEDRMGHRPRAAPLGTLLPSRLGRRHRRSGVRHPRPEEDVERYLESLDAFLGELGATG